VTVNWREHLVSGARIAHGQLCAAGTHVFVTNILDSSAEGAGRDEVLESYSVLQPVHIDAALSYAAELAREESVLPVLAL